MKKKPVNRLPLYIVIIFSLCLCNLVLREFVVNLENCIACSPTQDLAEHGGVTDSAHLHDHEELFVASVLAATQLGCVRPCEPEAVDLPACSRALSPLLPPPKAA